MARKKDERAAPEAEGPLPLPYRHGVVTARLAEAGGGDVAVRPSEAETAAIAGYLGILDLSDLSLQGRLEPDGEGWRLAATLRAAPVQACVVTLEPVQGRIEVAVERRYLPGVTAPSETELELGPDDDRAPEPLEAEIDLAQPMIEDLALALDPFPRHEGAEHGTVVYAPPGSEPLTDEAARPFAGLAALKSRLEDGSTGGGSGGDGG